TLLGENRLGLREKQSLNYAPLSVSQQGASLCSLAASMERPTFVVNQGRIAIKVPSASAGKNAGDSVDSCSTSRCRKMIGGRGAALSLGDRYDHSSAGFRAAATVAVEHG